MNAQTWRVILAYLLHLLLPGLGHLWIREYTFGLFISLIALIAAATFMATFFIPIPLAARLVLLILPVLFYLSTFVDLYRSSRRYRGEARSTRSAVLFVALGMIFQLFSPSAPLNFVLRNRPELFILTDSRFAPRYREGQLMWTNSLAYRVKLPFLDRPLFHALPERYRLVRFRDENHESHSGLVIGLPGEQIEFVAGMLFVDGVPDEPATPLGKALGGDCPLTTVDDYSILVAELRLGDVSGVKSVALDNLTGEVSGLF